MTEILRWAELSRDSLPGLIAEGEMPPDVGYTSMPGSNGKDLFVGLSTEDRTLKPRIIVLNAHFAQEILAWLATYSPASFPITQSVRTLSTEDFASMSSEPIDVHRGHDEAAYWSCCILGELLGQGEQFSAIDLVALSRAGACFSFTQARTEGLYGPNSAMATQCSRRLAILESDKLFVRRSITIQDLTPIWKWTRAHSSDHSVQVALSKLVEDVVSGSLLETRPPESHRQVLHSFGFDATALGTGTIEARVRAYQYFTLSLERGRPPEIAMLLAAAAICVGNGTSHISLLEEFGRKVPAAYAWFGFFSAVAGPKAWDPSWNRAINSIGRALRNRFEPTDAPGFDLSWVEYDFVRAVPKPIEFVRHVPKLFSKSLSIEVVPGATCQLRLSDDSIHVRAQSNRQEDAQPREQSAQRETRVGLSPQLTADLYEAERLLSRGQALIRQAIAAGDARVPDQARLFGESVAKPKKRNSKKPNKSG
jgi:hypothetical protein